MDSSLKAVDAFKQAILLDPDRQLDPTKISPKITSAFLLALGQVLVVRQLKVDGVRFVAGRAGAGVPIRLTIPTPARVRVRARSGATSLLIDSSAVTGTVSLRWPAVLRSGEPVPQGTWQIVVEATAGQNSFSASQGVRVSYGSVDTAAHVTSLPGYQELSETEIPPQSWRPPGLPFLYTAGALGGTLGLAGGAGSAQHLTIGAQGVMADYKEVDAGLRYSGWGYGGTATAQWRKFRAEVAVVRLSLDPAKGSSAPAGVKATQLDAWIGYAVSPYASLEVGLARRSPSDDFEAQSLGAIRLGARSAYEIGPGAVISLRGNYLAAAKFSRGGPPPFAPDLGLGLDLRLASRVHALAHYQFQRVDRKTNPGGTGEISAPLQLSVARAGLAVGF